MTLFEYLTSLYSDVYQAINHTVNGNDFASGLILTGLSGLLITILFSFYKFTKETLTKQFTTQLILTSRDISFYDLLSHFEQIGLSNKGRTIKVFNKWDSKKREDAVIKGIGHGQHIFFYKGVPLLADLQMIKENNYNTEILTVYKLGRSHAIFDQMINELRAKTDDPDHTYFYKYLDDDKQFITSQVKRTFDSIVTSDSILSNLTSRLDAFVNNEQWYIDHHVPYQLGILLYGEPGTGKTSLIRGIAAYLNRDIVYVSCQSDLIKASQSVKNSIIVAEEIDTYGIGKRNLNIDDNNDSSEVSSALKVFEGFSLGGVLNALDGIITNHGRIIIMTTNNKDTLDDALIRPGRIDLSIYLSYLTIETFEKQLKFFFEDVPDLSTYTIHQHISPAIVQDAIISGKNLNEVIDTFTCH